MNLFCTAALQQKLNLKCGKAPVPDDPLDCWCAALLTLRGVEVLAAILPIARFCVLLRRFPAEDWSKLNAMLVRSIREAMGDLDYGIPAAVVDQYMPEDTVFQPCATGDRDIVGKVIEVIKKLQEFSQPASNGWKPFDPQQLQRTINSTFFAPMEYPLGILPWQALRSQLHQAYGKVSPAIELEVSLLLGKDVARRILIVPAEDTFTSLHQALHVALRWEPCGVHRFKLPAVREREAVMYVLSKDYPKEEISQDTPCLGEEEARLGDYLQEGDRVQYLHTPKPEWYTWNVRIDVLRLLPDYRGEAPLCTLCEGNTPPDWLSGPGQYQEFRRTLRNPRDPEHTEMLVRGRPWLQEDSASAINTRLPHSMDWL